LKRIQDSSLLKNRFSTGGAAAFFALVLFRELRFVALIEV
jgi:hypothetical protein